MALAALTSVIWGLAFVFIEFGLESFSAPQLTALRFLIACLPVVFFPRPPIPWRYPAAMVAPFAPLAPCTGLIASAIILGEQLGAARYAGMALILIGLAVVVLPLKGPSFSSRARR
ncbi:MAG: hypothetical protein ACREVS_05575 [Burkholderiales bacterium]